MTDTITITVAGQCSSGKSAIIRMISEALAMHGVTNIEIDWGDDREPRRTIMDNNKAMMSVAERNTPVMLRELALNRGRYD